MISTSKNITILLFRGYSCGNFLANILCYNKNFIPKIPNPHQGALYEAHEYFDMDFKHKVIMDSVPNQKSEVKNWNIYELGCEGFYNFNLDRPLQLFDNTDDSIEHAAKVMNPVIPKILEMNGNIFIVAHGQRSVDLGMIYFPNARVVKLVNDRKVNIRSQILKTNEVIDREHQFNTDSNIDHINLKYYFDMLSMFNEIKFFNEIDKLLTWYGVEDKSLDSRVKDYYKKYIGLYDT